MISYPVIILVLMFIFIPFWFSLIYKHSTWITKGMVFLWCCVVSVMVFMASYEIYHVEFIGKKPSTLSIIILVVWAFIGQYMGINAVLSDKRMDKNVL